jgi:outer membrane protein insertion porin family
MLSNVTIPPDEQEQEKLVDGRFADVGVGLLRDTRDNPFDARRGTSLRLGTRVFAKPLGSEFSFTKTGVTWTFHLPTAKKTSLATAGRGGVAIPFGTDVAVPISAAYFAGGDSTIRGFARDAVGPASGGEVLLILNQEFRYPIWRSLRGIVFYDAGNVYDFVSNFDPLDLRYVLGLGLRLETPVGPFRVEYGRKLDREPGESGGELFFAIGSAF